MGFINPAPVPFDVEEWRDKPHLERVKPLAQDWAENGFGTPYAIHVLYILKLIGFSLGAIAVIGGTTTGLGGIGDFGDWYTEPIVFQKLVAWMILWEMIGLGSSSMPLSFRFLPPIGCSLAWLRPGTIRLPPWEDRIPFTKGWKRTPIDILLYVATLGFALALLLSDGNGQAVTFSGDPSFAGHLDHGLIAGLLVSWGLLGLRDKVSYLCGRPEIYGLLMVTFLFPFTNFVIASQLVLICVWFGAATSKLNHHFSSVVAVMVSNTPWNRSKTIKKQLYRNWPEDLRPSTKAVMFAHLGTVIEFGLPLLLLVTQGGTIGTFAVIGMVIFHIHITSTFPLAVPLEWNLFMIFGVIQLFGQYGDVSWSTIDDPLVVAIIVASGVGIMLYGNFRPDQVSFLPSMRYYAGNWATSQWLFRKDTDAEQRFDKSVKKSSPIVYNQLEKLYDADSAEIFLTKALAFRAMHPHGRALNGLLPHAAVDGDVHAYHVREGEFLTGATVGWNFGDGHFHDQRLLKAVQDQCNFEEGELRIICLESQPIHIQEQRYRIYDAKTGLVETGFVKVEDMIARQPWLDLNFEFPVHVTSGGQGAAAPAETAPPRAAAPA